MNEQPLLTKYNFSGIELANRMMIAPTTRSRAGKGNVATNLTAKHYQQCHRRDLLSAKAPKFHSRVLAIPARSAFKLMNRWKGGRR